MTGSSPEREVMAVKKNEHLIASIKVRDRVARGSFISVFGDSGFGIIFAYLRYNMLPDVQ